MCPSIPYFISIFSFLAHWIFSHHLPYLWNNKTYWLFSHNFVTRIFWVQRIFKMRTLQFIWREWISQLYTIFLCYDLLSWWPLYSSNVFATNESKHPWNYRQFTFLKKISTFISNAYETSYRVSNASMIFTFSG